MRTRCAAIVNHPAVLKILRVVNSLRVVFLVRRGPLGDDNCRQSWTSILKPPFAKPPLDFPDQLMLVFEGFFRGLFEQPCHMQGSSKAKRNPNRFLAV